MSFEFPSRGIEFSFNPQGSLPDPDYEMNTFEENDMELMDATEMNGDENVENDEIRGQGTVIDDSQVKEHLLQELRPNLL